MALSIKSLLWAYVLLLFAQFSHQQIDPTTFTNDKAGGKKTEPFGPLRPTVKTNWLPPGWGQPPISGYEPKQPPPTGPFFQQPQPVLYDEETTEAFETTTATYEMDSTTWDWESSTETSDNDTLTDESNDTLTLEMTTESGGNFTDNSTEDDTWLESATTYDNSTTDDINATDSVNGTLETTTMDYNMTTDLELEMTTDSYNSTDNATFDDTTDMSNDTLDMTTESSIDNTTVVSSNATDDNDTVSYESTTWSSVDNTTDNSTFEEATTSISSDNATDIDNTTADTTLEPENTTAEFTLESDNTTAEMTTESENATFVETSTEWSVSDNTTELTTESYTDGNVTDYGETTSGSAENVTDIDWLSSTTEISETTESENETDTTLLVISTDSETSTISTTTELTTGYETTTTMQETTTIATTTTTTSFGVTYPVTWEFKIMDPWKNQYGDKQSSEYQQLSSNLKTNLKTIFSGILGNKFASTDITKFSEGSVVVVGSTDTTEGISTEELGNNFYDEVVNKRDKMIGSHEVDPASIKFNGLTVSKAQLQGAPGTAKMPGYVIGIIAALVIVCIICAIIALIIFQQKRHRSHRLNDDDYMFDDEVGSDGLNGVAVKHWQSQGATPQRPNDAVTNGRDGYSGVNMYEMTENNTPRGGNTRSMMPLPPKEDEVGIQAVQIEGVNNNQTNYGYQPETRIDNTVLRTFNPNSYPERDRGPSGVLRVPIGTEDFTTQTSQH